MRGKRLKHTINLWLRLSASKRMKYLKENHVFASVGENCIYMDRRVPLYANLIKIGNNVKIASSVSFTCHDVIHSMLNKLPKNRNRGGSYSEKIGCIEIGDNVFIGARSMILYDVKIGSNVIIGARSLVNKDIPDNSVVAGAPARVIGSFDDFCKKREAVEPIPENMKIVKETISPELAEMFWKRFEEERGAKG